MADAKIIIIMNPVQYDLNALKSFFLLYKHRSVTGAAKVSGVTQPSMSRTLNKLRDEYQDRLFIRQKDQLVPTVKADFLMTQLSPLFEQIFQVMEVAEPFKPAQATGNFYFSAPEFISKFAMANLPTGLLSAAPKLEFHYSYWSSYIVEQLKSGELDLAFGYLAECPNHVKSHMISQDKLVLLHRPGFQPDITSVQQVIQYPHIVLQDSGVMDDIVDRQLASVGLQRDKVVITPDVDAAFRLLMKSDYLMLAPSKLARYFASEAVQASNPLGLMEVDYSLYWGAVKDQNEQHKFIREMIIAAFKMHWPKLKSADV